jgi:hypothetical protein
MHEAYCDDVINFIEISLKSFWAANQQNFTAVGIGEMIVDVPNGINTSQLRLTEVLYSPKVGYTLVSIGRLNEIRFSVMASTRFKGLKGSLLVQSKRLVVAYTESHMSLKQRTLQQRSLPWTSSIVEWDIFLLKWHESSLTKHQ